MIDFILIVNKESKNLITVDFGRLKLFTVVIYFKNIFGKYKRKVCYPTLLYITDKNGKPLFYVYCDENGKNLKNRLSKRINNAILKLQ